MEATEKTTPPWYDSRETIIQAVKKGLVGVHDLAKARHAAGYDRDEILSEWCIAGLFWTDTCGNFGKITQGTPRDQRHRIEIPDVMDHDEMYRTTPSVVITHGYAVPPSHEKCDRCLKGWDMENIQDYYEPRRQGDSHRHETCRILQVIEDEQKLFREILDASDMPYTGIRAIPNEYYTTDPTYFGPWFIVTTQWGALRIGYRKRVISIKWDDTQINHNGGVTFKDEGVTVGRTMVHAWGKDKAIEYLSILAKGNYPSEAA